MPGHDAGDLQLQNSCPDNRCAASATTTPTARLVITRLWMGKCLGVDRGIPRPDNGNHWLCQQMQIATRVYTGRRIIKLGKAFRVIFAVTPQQNRAGGVD
jgi:hypothetical protein